MAASRWSERDRTPLTGVADRCDVDDDDDAGGDGATTGMITLEELVIQSLYYRLVVTRVVHSVELGKSAYTV